MSPARVKNPQRVSPDCILRCTACAQHIHPEKVAIGLYYKLMDAWTCDPVWTSSPREAMELRGGGVASAMRALERRGYTTEKVEL